MVQGLPTVQAPYCEVFVCALVGYGQIIVLTKKTSFHLSRLPVDRGWERTKAENSMRLTRDLINMSDPCEIGADGLWSRQARP